MLHRNPLKTLILNNNSEEIIALKSLIQKFPDDLYIEKITGDPYDLRVILSAEKFDCTFFDESSFSIDIIPHSEVDKFGCLIFKNKKSSHSASNKLPYNLKPFHLDTFSHFSLSKLIKSLRSEIAERTIEQSIYDCLDKKIVLKSGREFLSLSHSSIVYTHTEGNYTNIHYLYSNKLAIICFRLQLPELFQKLNSPAFLDINRNELFNIKYFHSITPSGKAIILTVPGMENIQLKLSERKRSAIIKAILKR
jgi:hypothetical protein